MPVPPDELPEGLSTNEYRKLAALYGLMGRVELAVEATLRAEGEPDAPEPDADSATIGTDAGLALARSFLSAMRKAIGTGTDASADGINSHEAAGSTDPFDEIRQQLSAIGVPEEDSMQWVENLAQRVTEMKEAADPPPTEVPRGLTASGYWDLGQKYKEVGWTEQAREALQYAIDLDRGGELGRKALTFLRSRIPRVPVTPVAVAGNVLGFNQWARGDLEGARQTFQTLMREYPDFEWPYGNLGALLIQTGDLDGANAVLEQAVAMNPNYLNAWVHLAKLHGINSDFDAAYRCLDRAEEIDPEETGIISIRRAIEDLAAEC